MASGYTKFNSILAAIEEELEGENERDDAKPTCRICIGEAKRPVVLSCGHLFCWACITHAADQEAEGQLCPRCKRPHNVQPEVHTHNVHVTNTGTRYGCTTRPTS